MARHPLAGTLRPRADVRCPRRVKRMRASAALKAMARLFASAWGRRYARSFRAGGLSDLGLRGEVRDAGKRVAWFGVAAWDVGHDWMLTSASVMALASFGLVLVAVRIFAMFAQWCSRACAGESCVVTLQCLGCMLILNARWCGFEQVRLSVAFSRGCAAHASRL